MKPLLVLLVAALALLGLAASTARGGADAGSPAAARDPGSGLDGSRIAFSRLRDTLASNEFLETEIWAMNGDGSEPRRLTHSTTWDLSPVWSPNGKTIAFYAVQFDSLGRQPVAPPHIYLVDADGSDQRLLTEARALPELVRERADRLRQRRRLDLRHLRGRRRRGRPGAAHPVGPN